MPAVDYHEYRRVLDFMEVEESRRREISMRQARCIVARDLGLSPGTLENIAKKRLKGLKGRVERAIDAGLVRFLERQRKGIEHELVMATARLERGNSGVVAKAEAARDALVSLIDEAKGTPASNS